MTARIHLNTAGAGIPVAAVLDAMTSYLVAERELGPYEAEERHASDLHRRIYESLGALVGSRPEEIALFASATDAWCRIVCHLDIPAGSRIWVTPYEYAGNLIALQGLARRRDAAIEVVPALRNGDLDLHWMRDALDERVALVSVTHMPSGCGIVLPVNAVGALLAGSEAVYVVDACQTIGQRALDVRGMGCDVLTGAGRKFLRGPRGCGFAFVATRLWDRIQPPFADLHTAEVVSLLEHQIRPGRASRFETAERSGAVVLGLLAALDEVGPQPHGASPELYDALVAAVGAVPGVRLISPGSVRAGIVSFVHDRRTPAQIVEGLAADDISGWAAFGSHTPLYIAAGGVSRFVRLSIHHHHDMRDVEATSRSLRRIAGA